MLFMLGLFRWWYSTGWVGALQSTHKRLTGLAEVVSIDILLRTLFSPWRRIITYPGAGLDARLRAFGDNLISRCIGFTMRVFVLLGAGVMFVVLLIVGSIELVAWPLIPIAGVVLIIKGLL